MCAGCITELVLGAAEAKVGHSINVYDIRIPCDVPPLCYDFTNIDNFLNDPKVQAALGVNRSWEECNMSVHIALLGDWMKDFASDVALTLAKQVPVLIYSGRDDYICNYLGGWAWTNSMDWPGKAQFNAQNLTKWDMDGKKVGQFKTYNNFTFLEVENAGHMVPLDQPKVSLEMIRLFINGKPFGKDEEQFQNLLHINLF